MIHRRTFISAGGLGFLIAAQLGWSQQTKSPYRIALVEAGTPSANQHFIDAFLVGLREFGYVPGKSIVVDARWAEGRVKGFRRALDELIPLRPEVIVVSSTLGAVEAKKATTSIPVIFIGITDPVGDAWSTVSADPAATSRVSRALPAKASSPRRFRRYGRWFPVLLVWPSSGTQGAPSQNAAGK